MKKKYPDIVEERSANYETQSDHQLQSIIDESIMHLKLFKKGRNGKVNTPWHEQRYFSHLDQIGVIIKNAATQNNLDTIKYIFTQSLTSHEFIYLERSILQALKASAKVDSPDVTNFLIEKLSTQAFFINIKTELADIISPDGKCNDFAKFAQIIDSYYNYYVESYVLNIASDKLTEIRNLIQLLKQSDHDVNKLVINEKGNELHIAYSETELKYITFHHPIIEVKQTLANIFYKLFNTSDIDNVLKYVLKMSIEFRREEFLKEAKNTIETLPIINSYIDPNTTINSYDDLCHILLKNCKGLVIAENHDQYCSKAFIIRNIERFEKLGVKVIVLEHMHTKNQLDLLSKYLADDSVSELPLLAIGLMKYLAGHQYAYHDVFNYLKLFEYAKQAGIIIIPIDSELTIKPIDENNSDEIENRIAVTNFFAYKMVNEVMASLPEEAKCIVLVGQKHTGNQESIPGIDKLLGYRNLYITNKEKDVEHHPEEYGCDILLEVDPQHYGFDHYEFSRDELQILGADSIQ